MPESHRRLDSNEPDSATASPGADARAIRDAMETVVLPVRPGATPSERPPVEIYLGTEPAQYRANRVFGWSIEKVRDPGREVRIHLMSELPGFNRRLWTTGFTNYRFAIPAFQNGAGRAIYNDEDQIYLTDPGVLFDAELGEAGHLSISDTESSVMLIDCERMSSVWTLEESQRGWKRDLLRKAAKATGHRGDLDPHWNARDEEYEPGRSHLLHYTTLHTQPWRPFPERFVYQKGAYTELWHELEREAIAEGFEFFTRAAPSRAFSERLDRLKALPRSELGSGLGVAGELAEGVESLARRTKSSGLVELQPDLRGEATLRPGRFGLDDERRVGLLEWLADEQTTDAAVSVEGFESLPVWDVPWIVESLFEKAERFVYVAVRTPDEPPRRRFLIPPQGTTHTPGWWRAHFEAASRRHPEISWTLALARGRSFDDEAAVTFAQGGPRPDDSTPTVWSLTDGAPGNDTQVAALVDALGWSAEARRVPLGARAALPFMTGGAHLRTVRGSAREVGLSEPWPDLVIVAGRRVAPIARWIREQARGRTRIVALGPKVATPADAVDVAVTPRAARLFPHPNRLETERPLVAPPKISPLWHERIAAISGRHLVLVFGSGSDALGIDREGAEALGRLVSESAASLGCSVAVTASRHARPDLLEACLSGLGRVALVHRETSEQRSDERPWGALLEGGDLFVLIGLGETTLAELVATGKPVFLAPRRDGRRSPWAMARDAVLDWISERAQARPENDRGTVRPQEGLELLSARLIERGWVRPRRDAEGLRGRLVRAGHARLLRAPIRAHDLEGFKPPPPSEVADVAAKVRAMLGVALPDRRSDERPD